MVIPKRILSYRHASNLYWMLTLVVIAIILLTFERFLLWKIQEENLFLATPLFWKQQMCVRRGSFMGRSMVHATPVLPMDRSRNTLWLVVAFNVAAKKNFQRSGAVGGTTAHTSSTAARG